MGVTYNPKIVTDGLVLALDAANVKSYPGSGTTWTDMSGNGNNVTLTNGPTFSSDNGGSIVFDGVNDTATLSNPSTLSNYTLSLWINIISYSGERQLFSRVDESLGITTYGGKYMIYNGNINSSNISIVNNVWKNVLVTTSGLSVILYLNGQVDSTWNNGRSITNGSCSLCSFYPDANGNNARNLNARLSNFQLYNRALSATEISQNFNALRGRYGI